MEDVSVARRRSLFERMRGAALLDVATYEEVEHDRGAMGQAAAVVGLVAVASAIGNLAIGPAAAVAAVVGAYLGWFLWALVTYLIGDKLLGGTATWGELLRTLGFAQTPGLLRAVAFIPFFGALISFVAAIWMLVAGIIAIRQACDFGTGRAILTAVIGWFAFVVAAFLLSLMIGVQPGLS